MKYRKAQSEVITTVLIILLVLAAIVIVWQVVQGTIKKGATGIEKGAACIGMQLEVTSANSTSNMVTITRKTGADDVAVSSVVFLVNGQTNSPTASPPTTTLAVFEGKTWTLTDFALNDKVKAAAKLSDGSICAETSEVIALA